MKKNKLDITAVRELHRTGQLEAAKHGYLYLLRKHPRDIEVLDSLGILSAQQDKFPEAIDYFQKALKIQPKQPILNLHLANILKIQGLFSQAADILKNSLKDNPNHASSWNNLGTVYSAQEKHEDAVHAYQQAIAKQSDYVDAYYNLGLALTKLNKFSEAKEAFQKIIELAPEHFAARFQVACLLMREEKIAEAIPIFLEIEAAHPNHFETQTNLATCYLKKGALNQAKQHYFQALELMPEDQQILFNLGVINMQQGNVDIAIQYYQRATKLNPDNFAIHNNLGVAFLAKQHVGFALHHFQEALRIQPNNNAIQHTIKILSEHQHLLASPPDYVKALFDSYADHYEPHLLEALDYQVPKLLLNAVSNVRKLIPLSLDILDLGCGTGLCGVPFKPYAKQMIGVDLSSKMLDVAKQKNIYDELICDDLVTFLSTKQACYDLVLAGDVLVYIGDLSPIFKEIHSALREKGLFTFNTEICEDVDFKMNQSGRFAHNKKYLEKLAKDNHFKIVSYEVVVTRQQNNEPVYGHLLILENGSPSMINL